MQHVIRYDTTEFPAAPDIIQDTYQGIVNRFSDAEGCKLFAQRLDDFDGESKILMFGLGVGLAFTTTTALARQLTEGD